MADWNAPAPVYSAPAPAPAPTPTSAPLSNADASAKKDITDFLATFGLAGLGEWAWAKWQAGETLEQISLEMRSTPEYKARFPAMEYLGQQGRALTEQQYLDYENQTKQLFRAAGLPAGFYDSPDDFTSLLKGNVGLPELQTRVQAYQTLAYQSPPEVLAAWHTMYGLTPGELTAYFIDPDKAEPLIQKRLASAEAAGWSNATGFGGLTTSQAEQVGQLGLSPEQTAAKFAALAQQNGLYQQNVGDAGDQGIDKDTALSAGFEGNAAAIAKIEEQKARRLSAFQAGGAVATNAKGAVGAGSAV